MIIFCLKSWALKLPTCPASKLAYKTFDEISDVLKRLLNLTPLAIAEWFRFYKTNESNIEFILEYMAELHRLGEHCHVGEYALRNRLVCGLSNEANLKWLLTEYRLTLTCNLEISIFMENTAHIK